jgi:cytochrome b561
MNLRAGALYPPAVHGVQNMTTHPAGYSKAQILLHWLIAALVIFQLLLGEDIVPAFRAFSRGEEPSAEAMFSADIHVYVGIAVLILACLRLLLRFRRGAPALPEGESLPLRLLAQVAHLVLYGAIFLMPLTGILAWYFGIDWIGEVHEVGKPIIIAVVAAHAAGALWQHFVMKSGALMRMIRPMP